MPDFSFLIDPDVPQTLRRLAETDIDHLGAIQNPQNTVVHGHLCVLKQEAILPSSRQNILAWHPLSSRRDDIH